MLKNHYLVGTLWLLCGVILFSAMQLREGLLVLAAWGMGLGVSPERSALMVVMYVLSGVFALAGVGVLVAGLLSGKPKKEESR